MKSIVTTRSGYGAGFDLASGYPRVGAKQGEIMARSIDFKIAILPFMAMLSVLNMSDLRAAESTDAVRQKFIGDWVLVSFVRFPENAGQIAMDYIGRLRYDEAGYMMGLGMPRDLPMQARGSTEQVTGGFAYWGKVSIEPENGRVIHHVEGSPGAAQWVGQDNVRYYEFDGDLLKLSLKDATGRITATLTWRRE